MVVIKDTNVPKRTNPEANLPGEAKTLADAIMITREKLFRQKLEHQATAEALGFEPAKKEKEDSIGASIVTKSMEITDRAMSESAKQLTDERKTANELGNQLHQERQEHLKTYFDTSERRLGDMEQRIKEAQAGSMSPIQVYKEIHGELTEMVQELDELRNKNRPANVGIDSQTAIILKKMEMEHSVTLLTLQNDMQQRKMEWDLTLKKWEDEKDTKKEQWERSHKTQEGALGGLTDLGMALVQNISVARGVEGVASQPPPQVRNQSPPQQAQQEEEQVDVTMTAGPCPSCGDRIEIPDGAQSASCANCGSTFKVKRRTPV